MRKRSKLPSPHAQERCSREAHQLTLQDRYRVDVPAQQKEVPATEFQQFSSGMDGRQTDPGFFVYISRRWRRCLRGIGEIAGLEHRQLLRLEELADRRVDLLDGQRLQLCVELGAAQHRAARKASELSMPATAPSLARDARALGQHAADRIPETRLRSRRP